MTPDNATLAGYLRGARDLLADPGRWTPEHWQTEPWRKALARTASGLACSPHDEDAVCWSLAGAIERQMSTVRCTGSMEDLRTAVSEWREKVGWARMCVSRALADIPGDAALIADYCTDQLGFVHIDAWASWKTHADVLAVLDAAIRGLELEDNYARA